MPCTARLDLNVSAASRQRSHTHTLFSRTLFSRTFFSRTLRTLGGRAWRHPQRDAANDANGHPCRDRRPIGRHGMWCRRSAARCTVPPFGGTVYRRRESPAAAGDGRRQRSLPAARCAVPGDRRARVGGGEAPKGASQGRLRASCVRTLGRPGSGRAVRCRRSAARYLARPVASGQPIGWPVRRLLRQALYGKGIAWAGEALTWKGVRGMVAWWECWPGKEGVAHGNA